MIEKCLVIVPHQDDETMLAGSTIHALRNNGVEVYVLYSTNGDWKYPADLRIREAAAALKILGDIPEDHIILMGYGDTYNNPNHTHYFYSESVPVKSASGHSHTYGANGITDYRYKKSGVHSEYTKSSYLDDLESIIKDIRADLIICVDFDEHTDHRMLSLCFDKVMGRVLKEDDYHPVILKGFAYCNAYTAIDDFYEKQLGQTKRPEVGITGKYQFDMIDTSVYQWNSRVQVFSSPEFRKHSFSNNIKAKALKQHKSQYVILRAGRIINSDEVFWIRKTSSISYKADVSVSDGEGKYLNDFKLYNCSEIDSETPRFCDYLWCPKDEMKTASFRWNEAHDISKCVIYGNIESSGHINKVQLTFDNGFIIESGPLPEKGAPLTIEFDTQHAVRACCLRIISDEGCGAGIAECEFYDESEINGLDLIERYSAPPTVNVKENLTLIKIFNSVYLWIVKSQKFLHRCASFLKRRGMKGVANKILHRS